MKRCFNTFTIVCLLGAVAFAQRPRRDPTPNDTLKSPEILSDNRVVFRIYAPKADEVSVGGDWVSHGRGTGGKLTKDEQGVFSITVGPLIPDLYAYSFNVDGVKTLDPKNPMIKPGISGADNMFYMPGPETAFEDNKPGPHGEVRISWYQSKTLDAMRSVHVYTPPGYESGNTKYPVFYLLHGSGDDDYGWSTIGRAGFIMDNLLAAKKVKPMLVVMPNASMPRTSNTLAAAERTQAQERFVDELMNSVMPHVEKHYRVLTNRDNRALAGLSMGGGQTLATAPAHLDKFAYVGIFSSGLNPQSTESFLQRNAAFFENPEKTNKMLKLFWISVGERDTGALASARNLSAILKDRGIKHQLHETEGGHTWINWRRYLHDYAQLIFK